MSAELALGEMTCFETAEDGSSVRLDTKAVDGRLLSVRMPLQRMNRLIMILPSTVTQAVQRRHSDPTLRVGLSGRALRARAGQRLHHAHPDPGDA